jgi:hypothetical protein
MHCEREESDSKQESNHSGIPTEKDARGQRYGNAGARHSHYLPARTEIQPEGHHRGYLVRKGECVVRPANCMRLGDLRPAHSSPKTSILTMGLSSPIANQQTTQKDLADVFRCHSSFLPGMPFHSFFLRKHIGCPQISASKSCSYHLIVRCLRLNSRRSSEINSPSPLLTHEATTSSFITPLSSLARGHPATTSRERRKSSLLHTPQDGEPPTPTTPTTSKPELSLHSLSCP